MIDIPPSIRDKDKILSPIKILNVYDIDFSDATFNYAKIVTNFKFGEYKEYIFLPTKDDFEVYLHTSIKKIILI